MRIKAIIVFLTVLILAIPQQAFSLRPTSTATSEPIKDWLKLQKHKVDIKVLMPPLEPAISEAKPVSPAVSIATQSAFKRSV